MAPLITHLIEMEIKRRVNYLFEISPTTRRWLHTLLAICFYNFYDLRHDSDVSRRKTINFPHQVGVIGLKIKTNFYFHGMKMTLFSRDRFVNFIQIKKLSKFSSSNILYNVIINLDYLVIYHTINFTKVDHISNYISAIFNKLDLFFQADSTIRTASRDRFEQNARYGTSTIFSIYGSSTMED